METAVKTKRITILGTPEFKDFLNKEAKKEGVSVAKLIRQRCEKKPTNNEDEELLSALVKEVSSATAKAKLSLERGLSDVEKTLKDIGRA